FPDFAQLCSQARKIEQNIMQVPPAKILGSLIEDSFSIYPKEMREYTYAYLLSEANKIERKVFAQRFAAQPQAFVEPPVLALGKQKEEAAKPQVQAPSSKEVAAKKQSEEAIAIPISKQELPEDEKPPLPSQKYATDSNFEIEKQSKLEDSGDQIPLEVKDFESERKEDEILEVPKPQEDEEKPLQSASQKESFAAPIESKKDEAEKKDSISKSPKISPRLRQIIEEKLRREELQKKEEKLEIEVAPPSEEKRPEAPVIALSAKERLLAKLQKAKLQPKQEEYPPNLPQSKGQESLFKPEEKTAKPLEVQQEEMPLPEPEEIPEKPKIPMPTSASKLKAPTPKKAAWSKPQKTKKAESKPLPKKEVAKKAASALPQKEQVSQKEKEERPSEKKTIVPAEKQLQEPKKDAQEKAKPPVATISKPSLVPGADLAESQEKSNQISTAPVRILPGGVRTFPSLAKTYVPPARDRILPKDSMQKAASPQPKVAEPEPSQVRIAKEIESAAVKIKRLPVEKIAKAIPKKEVLDEPVEKQKTFEEIEEEKRRADAAAKLAKKLALHKEPSKQIPKTREIAGQAELPLEEEEDLPKVPLPKEEKEEDIPIPLPEQYEAAKEEFKYKAALEEKKEEISKFAASETEEMLEEYAKENLLWLYEIYKMGGMSREDFLQKVKEKMAEEKGEKIGSSTTPEPSNPAFQNISKEIEKKSK
ncbi:MAG: hypothetical protein QW275_02760, partial [Candidatus Anstonellaceae archaeon]